MTSTTVDNHFRFENFELILLSDNSMPKYSQTRFNTRIKLFYNDRIRYSATRSRRKLAIASTRSERFNIRGENDGCKPGDPYIL